ncbi:MAG: protein kinase [Anaerolineae bacterium]|nr:protein kinase [Anaerolineae bacterium]
MSFGSETEQNRLQLINTAYATSPFGLSTIGRRYVLGDILGEGGMGIVYRATDRLTGKQVALKRVTMPSEGEGTDVLITNAPEESLRVALANEFRLLASLRHPNIISVLDYGVDEWRQPYYTMELLTDSRPLLQAAHDQSIENKLILLIQVLQALSYLHRHDIIHRDLTPDNVHVIDNQVKIIDFGLAILASHDRGDHVPAGTLAYMAPEVLSGNSPTSAADLYAVGVIAYELLVGQHPFDYRHTDLNTFTQQLLEQTPDLSVLETTDGVRAVIEKLLAKHPEARFQSAHECIEALNAAFGYRLIQETNAIRESFVRAARFVGRTEEIKQLDNALHEASHGGGSAWLVGGDSGVGKSRLLDEIHNRAMLDGFLVLRGQGIHDAGPFYQMWREPIRRLALMSDLSDQTIAVLQTMAPDIGELVGRNVPDTILSESERQHRLNLAIVDVFRRQRQPILLLLEDLQWAEDSLQPLRLLSGLINNLPLMILGAYRSDERPGLPHELPFVHTLFIERLNEADILSLSQSMIGEVAKRPSVISIIQQESEGNAFFITEVVRTLAEATGRLEDIGEVTLPPRFFAEGIHNVIRRRLTKLPSVDRTFYKTAALIGRQINIRLLQTLYDVATVEQHIMHGSELAIIEIRDDRWRFSHDHLREALLADMGDEERQATHLRIARAIEIVYPNDDTYVMSLFEHWYAAKELSKAAYYVQKTASRLLTSGDYAGALERVERVMRAFDSEYAPETTFSLLSLAGRAHQLLGNFKLAIGTHEQGVAFARRHGLSEQAAVLTAHIGRVHAEQGNYKTAKDYLRSAYAAAQATANHRVLMVGLWGLGYVALMQGDHISAQRQLLEAASYAGELGDRICMTCTQISLAVIAAYQFRLDEARGRFQSAIVMARESGTQRYLIHALGNYATFLQHEGEFPLALSYYEECQQISRESGDKRAGGLILIMLGAFYYEFGDLMTARYYAEDGLDHAMIYDDLRQQALAYNILAGILREQDDFAAAIIYSVEALTLFRKMEDRRSMSRAYGSLAKTKARLGNLIVARSLHRKSLALAREILAIDLIVENLTHLGILELQRGYTESGTGYLVEALQLALIHDAVALIVLVMIGIARLAISAERLQHGAELYALVAEHPRLSANARTRMLPDLDESLRYSLTDEERFAAEAVGRTLDLRETARAELAFWSPS